MRFLLILLACIVTLQASEVYNLNCASCHGMRGEVTYLNKVPPIRSMSSKDRLKALKNYKYGNLNVYGYGIIMKANIVKFGDKKIKDLNSYIDTFKDDFDMQGAKDGKN